MEDWVSDMYRIYQPSGETLEEWERRFLRALVLMERGGQYCPVQDAMKFFQRTRVIHELRGIPVEDHLATCRQGSGR